MIEVMFSFVNRNTSYKMMNSFRDFPDFCNYKRMSEQTFRINLKTKEVEVSKNDLCN